MREELTVAAIPPGGEHDDCAVMPFADELTGPAADAISSHAERFALRLLEPAAGLFEPTATGHEKEVRALLAATYFAAGHGYARVFWPASAAAGEGLSLDRIAQITDAALLVGRLVSLDASTHGVPSIHVHTPFADLSTAQVRELIEDMGLTVAA